MRFTLPAGVALAAMLAAAPSHAQDTVRWKMASVIPASVPVVGDGAVYFTDRVAEVTRGRIEIEAFDPGKLVPATQVYDAVRTGSVDAGWSFSCYWMGKNSANPLFCTVPFGLGLTHYLAWIYEGGGQELWAEIYAKDGLWATPCSIAPPETSGWFKEEITSVEQFEGMKVRFPGIAGKVLQKLGASVQLIPGADIFVALERGVIDATEFALPNVDLNLGFYKVAKHYYFPGWHQPATIGEFVVSKDAWDALDPADRAAIEMACRDTMVRAIAKFEAAQTDALETMQAAGVEVHVWSDEILDAFRQATDEVMAEMAAENPDFARVYDSLNGFREKHAQWRELTRPLR